MIKGRVLRSDGTTLLERCGITETSAERMTGLLARTKLDADEGLWFPKSTSAHMFFMKFAIDIAFLDGKGRVIAIYHDLKPWRLTWIHPFAAMGGMLETSAGCFQRAGIKKGEELRVCPIS